MAKKLDFAVKVIVGVLSILILVFLPAGTFRWPEAWLFLILYFSYVGGLTIWMKKKRPDLYKERTSKKTDIKSWDKKIIVIYTLLIIIMLAVAGLDVVRFSWSRVPLALKILGFMGYIPAMIILFSVFAKNPFLSQLVRIQADRGHRVCATGPYKYVRHPMYVGIMISILCVPLSLGSFYALIPGSLIVFLFVLRTSLEDKTLYEELPGYREYAESVRYRLIPGIW